MPNQSLLLFSIVSILFQLPNLLIDMDLVVFCFLMQPEQLTKIFELCGTPDELNWPGVTKMVWYNNFKPSRPIKRRVKEVFKQ